LRESKLLFDKYDEILILSPSLDEWRDLLLPEENYCDKLNFNFIYKRIDEIKKSYKAYVNVKLFDDLRF
jgi:hypothetical protein